MISTLVCGLVQSQMHDISGILFSGMNSTMVIPMCHGQHQTTVTKPRQTFLYSALPSNMYPTMPVSRVHISLYFLSLRPHQLPGLLAHHFLWPSTHESMTPICYTLFDPHNCSSTTLDPEDEGITVLQFAGN